MTSAAQDRHDEAPGPGGETVHGEVTRRRWRAQWLAFSLLLLFGLLALFQWWIERPSLTLGGQAVDLNLPIDLISHAGAGLPVATYSNSVEAIDLAVARGHRAIEIDLHETRDGHLIAAHDWDETYRELHPASLPGLFLRPLIGVAAPSHSEFMAERMRGGLTPLDAAHVAAWLKAHPAVSIVTDAKGDNLTTLRTLLALGIRQEQIIPQIYARGELAAVRRLGFGRIIYTLYRDIGVPLREVAEFARANGVAVTIHDARASPAAIALFRRRQVPLYVHTVNDPERARMLADWGVTGVYTDFLY